MKTVTYLVETILALHAEAVNLPDSELATIVSDVSVGLCLGDYGPVANQQFADCEGEWDTDSVIAAIRAADSEADHDEYRAISIFMDGVFSGSGRLEGNMEDGHTIRDCGAQFCDDADASEDVYGDIEEAINLGKKGIVVTLDGVKRSIVWSIVEPM